MPDNGRSVSFRISADDAMFSSLMDGDNWPKLIKLKKFHFFTQRKNRSCHPDLVGEITNTAIYYQNVRGLRSKLDDFTVLFYRRPIRLLS